MKVAWSKIIGVGGRSGKAECDSALPDRFILFGPPMLGVIESGQCSMDMGTA